MQMQQFQNGSKALIAASLMAMVLGSVHAFSVFLEPLEFQFGQPRAQVSLTYSLALASLTIAVLLGPRIYGRWSPSTLCLTAFLGAALGAFVAGLAPSLTMVWIGYGVIFGLANGLGYGFGLQLAARANPTRQGLSMGIVTAFYALGAALSPAAFSILQDVGGFRLAMAGLVLVLIGLAPICAALLRDVRFATDRETATTSQPRFRARTLGLLWLGYGAGVAAGLMTIGHAAGIATQLNPAATAWHAPALLAICNLAGSLSAGRLTDHLAPRALLIGLPLLTAAAVLTLATLGTAGIVLPALGIIGFAYGGTIAAYPAAIAIRFAPDDGPRIYGRVFTAWGLAGLTAPWLAGRLFDATGTYDTALLAAGILAGLSAGAASLLPRHHAPI